MIEEEDDLPIQVGRGFDSGWYWIEAEVVKVFAAKIGIYALGVYNVLACMENHKSKSSFPTQKTIAKTLDISLTKVKESVAILEAEGLLKKHPRVNPNTGATTSNVYELLSAKAAVDHSRAAATPQAQSDYPPSRAAAPNKKNSEPEEINKNIPAKQVIPVPLRNMISNQLSSEDIVITDDDDLPAKRKQSNLDHKLCHVWSLHTKTNTRKLGPKTADLLAAKVRIAGELYSSPNDLWDDDEDFQDWVEKIVDERLGTGVIKDLTHLINWIRSYDKCGFVEFKNLRNKQRDAELIKKSTKSAEQLADDRMAQADVPLPRMTAEELAAHTDY